MVRRVFWDLETTGFLPKGRIVSIGWSHAGKSGEVLVLPNDEIDPSASAVHGWTKDKLRKSGAVTIASAIDEFCKAIVGEPTILCAHNGKSFDTHVLRAELERVGTTLPHNVIGFADTMLWFRKLGRRRSSLDALANDLLGCASRELHSAADDAMLLERVVLAFEAQCCPTTQLVDLAETADAFDTRTQRAAVRGVLDALVHDASSQSFLLSSI